MLRAAFDGLEPDAKKLLGRLSFFSSAVPYETLAALNPRLPPRPEAVQKPSNSTLEPSALERIRLRREQDPAKREALEERYKRERREKFDEALAAHEAYLAALAAWETSPKRRAAERWLRAALQLLQRRGLVIREAGRGEL